MGNNVPECTFAGGDTLFYIKYTEFWHMITTPNCKINIGLHIVEKRPDGYHNIETVFYPIPLCDTLEIEASDTCSFSQSGIEIGGNPDDNLCVKAYRMLKSDFPHMGNVRMRLEKNIPFGAGLGGGSSDAACTLQMLNGLFALHLQREQLQDYARKLGADCAVFIENKPVYAHQRGDVFVPMELSLDRYRIVVVKPDICISTAEAYAGIVPSKPNFNLQHALQKPIETWKHTVVNDFEKTLFGKYPVLERIKQTLYQQGALYASMSGSGSALYGIFSPSAVISREDFPDTCFIYPA